MVNGRRMVTDSQLGPGGPGFPGAAAVAAKELNSLGKPNRGRADLGLA